MTSDKIKLIDMDPAAIDFALRSFAEGYNACLNQIRALDASVEMKQGNTGARMMKVHFHVAAAGYAQAVASMLLVKQGAGANNTSTELVEPPRG